MGAPRGERRRAVAHGPIASLGEAGVPLIPDAALAVGDLNSAAQDKVVAPVLPHKPQRERGLAGDKRGDLAEVLEVLIGPSDGRAAILADDDEGRVAEAERGAAPRAAGDGAQRALPGRWGVPKDEI